MNGNLNRELLVSSCRVDLNIEFLIDLKIQNVLQFSLSVSVSLLVVGQLLFWVEEIAPVGEDAEDWAEPDAILEVVVDLTSWLEAAREVPRRRLGQVLHEAEDLEALRR